MVSSRPHGDKIECRGLQAAAAAVLQERVREVELELICYEVVRWTFIADR